MATVDHTSPTWQAIHKHAQAQLTKHRAELEKPGLEERKADEIRGRIAELKELLGLINPERPIVLSSVDYSKT